MAYAALEKPTIKPAVRNIAAITRSFPAIVTTTFAHGYGPGMIVRFFIPPDFGMRQMNGLSGTLLAVSDTTFSIDIDTIPFDAFVIPPDQPTMNPEITAQAQYAQVVPVGEVNTTLAYAFKNVLPY